MISLAADKLDELLRASVKELRITREVMGELHEDVIESLQVLATVQEARQDWAAARLALQEAITIRRRQPNQKDWRIGDARRALDDLDRRAALNPSQRQRLQEAGRLTQLQGALFRQGRYAEGIDPCRKAMEIQGELLGENHPDYAASLHNLGTLFQGMGEYAKAEPMLRQALEIRKNALGENHPDYANSLNSLAALHRDMEIQAAQKAAAARAQSEPLGPVRSTGLSEANPARQLQERDQIRAEVTKLRQAGKLDDAAALAVKELVVTREVRGELHEDVVDSLEFLARLQEVRENWAAARLALQEVIATRQRQPDRKGWRIGDVRRALVDLERRAAMTREQRNRLTKARALAAVYSLGMAPSRYRDAEAAVIESLKIWGELMGEDHADYAAVLYKLAAIYALMGDFARAEPLLLRALEIRKKALGEDHPDYAFSLDELGADCLELGDYARAESLHRRALEIWKNAKGEDHPNYAQSLHYLGTLYIKTGDYARATPLLRRALEIYKKAVGEDHPHYARSLISLGILYRSMGDIARAEPIYLRASEIHRKALGEDHPEYATSLNNLGFLYTAMGDYPKAESLYRRALQIEKNALGEDNPHYAVGLNNLGGLYEHMGEYARAEPLYRLAADITKKALGDEHTDYAVRLNNLAQVSRRWATTSAPRRCTGARWRLTGRRWARITPATPWSSITLA